MLNKIVELIKNTDEFTPIEKDESIATIMGYSHKWTRENAVKVLNAMEKGKAYRCKDLTPIITGREFKIYDQCGVNAFMKVLVKTGAIRREVVFTGREIEIPNPKIAKLQEKIADWFWARDFYHRHRDDRQATLIQQNIKQCANEMATLSPTIKVKEKIAYFYKTY